MSTLNEGLSANGPQSVVDQVSDEVLRLILSGEFTPGMPIAIQALGERFGVSSVPVREALRTLEGRGLIEFQRGRRPRVSPVRLEDFEDIFRLRVILEGEAARRRHPGPEHLPQLRASLASFERLLSYGETLAVYHAHAEFHTLMLPAATPWERRFLDELWVASERYIQLFLGSIDKESAIEAVYRAHVGLVEAVAEGDPAAIEAAIVAHVRESEEIVRDAVNNAASLGITASSTI